MEKIDTKVYRDCKRTGREELIVRIHELCAELEETRAELAFLMESYRRGLVLPGWFCSGCHAFNGEVKAKREVCRACGIVDRPVGP